MKNLLKYLIIISLLTLPAMAAFEEFYPFEAMTGKTIIPDENLGGPWLHDDNPITLGDGKDAKITYDDAMDKLYFNDTPLYLEEATTLGAGLDLGGKITGLTPGTVGTDATNLDQLWLRLNKSGDTMSGALAMGSQKITGLGTATSTGDAASIEDVWLRLNKSGDTMSGALGMGAQKITNLGTATATGDTASIEDVWLRLNKSGDTMSGPIAMGSQKITGLGTATSTGDAASIEDVWSRANKTGDTFTGAVTIPYLTVTEGFTTSSAYTKVSYYATAVDYNYSSTGRNLDPLILVDARSSNVTVTLPPAATGAGNITTIKAYYNPAANFVRINASGSEVMLTGKTMLYSTNDTAFLPAITLASDGAVWFVIDEYPYAGWTAADA